MVEYSEAQSLHNISTPLPQRADTCHRDPRSELDHLNCLLEINESAYVHACANVGMGPDSGIIINANSLRKISYRTPLVQDYQQSSMNQLKVKLEEQKCIFISLP